MAVVHLNIGTNLGDRHANLRRAVAGISALAGIGSVEVSSPVESEPWGFDSTSDFLNIGVMLQTSVTPEPLFEMLSGVERSISDASHRNADGSYRDRVIDIDMIAYDSLVLDSPRLRLPHPRMAERRFMLQPLAELDSGWRHPVTGLTAAEMLGQLSSE